MSSTPIPKALDDDPEDVSWALSTAATSLARGDRVEALKWLRRAAEAASEAERDARALELAKAAAELSTLPPTSIAPTPSRPPPPTPSRPPPPTPSRPPAPAPSRPAPSRPAPARSAPPPPLSSRPALPTPSRAAETREARSKANASKSKKPDETGKQRASRKSASSAEVEDKTQTHEMVITEVRPPLPTPTASVTAADADAWPTETSDPANETSPVYGQERTRIGQPAYKPDGTKGPPPVASQAVRVVIWRGADGVLRVAPHGTPVSAVAMEGVLVAADPQADLLAWFV